MNTTTLPVRTSHEIASELVRKGLASRKAWGLDLGSMDRRHSLVAKYLDLQRAETAACPCTAEHERLLALQGDLTPNQRSAARQMCRCGYC